MILEQTLDLKAKLAGAISANQPEYHVSYEDMNDAGEVTAAGVFRGALNGVSEVTICAAPSGRSVSRKVLELTIYNADSASATAILYTDDGTTERVKTRQTLLTLETLAYAVGVGFYVI